MTAPLTFEPIFLERMWGGRRLETEFGKKLPPNARIGESWEIVDRPEAQSVIANGPLKGKTLHELWTQDRQPRNNRGSRTLSESQDRQVTPRSQILEGAGLLLKFWPLRLAAGRRN